MEPETLKTLFGEWLPDLPELDGPYLTEATNAIWQDGGYKPFRPLTGSYDYALGSTLPAIPIAAIMPKHPTDTNYVYAASATRLYEISPTGAVTARSATLTSNSKDFAQFDNLVIAACGTNQQLLAATVGAQTDFTLLATTGTAPAACCVGVIGRFVVGGNVSVSNFNRIQWCAIDSPRNWPTPGTSTATANQAGEQDLPSELGNVMEIYGTDQTGIVLQQGGITRMTYVGGAVVFQFELVNNKVGSFFPHGSVMVDGLVYFAAQYGFYVTDGVSVKGIGEGKVNNYFSANQYSSLHLANGHVVSCGYEPVGHLIYWAFPSANATTVSSYERPDKILIYHIHSGRWTLGNQEMWCMVERAPSVQFSAEEGTHHRLHGFNSALVLQRFDGTAGAATFTTTEVETVPGKLSYVDGVKPLVTGTSPAVTVALATHNDLDPSTSTFTSDRTATASTGFADFRSSARYHKTRVKISGEFQQALGVEWRVRPEGSR